MDYFITLLAAYGLVFTLMNDKAWVLSKLRFFDFFDRMFDCAFCTGFHAGWLFWFIRVGIGGQFPVGGGGLHFLVGNVLAALLFSFASAAFCYGTDKAIMWLECER